MNGFPVFLLILVNDSYFYYFVYRKLNLTVECKTFSSNYCERGFKIFYQLENPKLECINVPGIVTVLLLKFILGL